STYFCPKPVLPRGLGSATTYPRAAHTSGHQRKLQPSSHAPCGPPWTRNATGYFFVESKPGGFRSHICIGVPPAPLSITLSGFGRSSDASSFRLAWLTSVGLPSGSLQKNTSIGFVILAWPN